MLAAFRIRERSGEILDLTAPAGTTRDGIVARWLRDALARSAAEETKPTHRAEGTAE